MVEMAHRSIHIYDYYSQTLILQQNTVSTRNGVSYCRRGYDSGKGPIRIYNGQHATTDNECLSENMDVLETWAKYLVDSGADHMPLTFGNSEAWGQKYNLVWDMIFGTELFSRRFMKRSVPLPENAEYLRLTAWQPKRLCKSNWILWCAALTNSDAEVTQRIKPVYTFLQDTPDSIHGYQKEQMIYTTPDL